MDTWFGDWNDTSSLWTDEIKQEVNFDEDPDDGLFWMSCQDFIDNFERINIAYFIDNYYNNFFDE